MLAEVANAFRSRCSRPCELEAEAAGFSHESGMDAVDGLGDAVGSDRHGADMAMSKRTRACSGISAWSKKSLRIDVDIVG